MKKKILLFIFLFLVFINANNEKSSVNYIYAENIDSTQNTETPSAFNSAIYNKVKTDINKILNTKQLNSGKFAVAIYSEKLNQWIYTRNYKELLVPASNTKLVTTFTTYSLLPDEKLKTKIITDGEITNGVLNGDLYIIGGGDALLSVADIETIADAIKHKGITQIKGNIYGDGSFFDNITDRFKYSEDKDEVQPTAPITALALERNEVRVIITTGARGTKPSVQFKPASSAFTFTNKAKTTASPTSTKTTKTKRKSASLLIIDDEKWNNEYVTIAGDSKLELAAKPKKTKRKIRNSNPISISTNLLEDGRQNFTINGSLPPNRTYSYKLYIKRPELAVASALKDRLQSGGIKVSGKASVKAYNDYESKHDSKEPQILYVFERDLNEIVNICNKNSDNYLAEMLFKINGATANKDKNTAKSASAIELEVLENCGINTKGFVFNDGSGLSRRNKITVEGLTMLIYKTQQQPFAANFFNTYPIAGVDGTLAKRMRNSFAQGNLIGKTGTLNNSSSLSGKVNTKSGDALYFSFIYNGGNMGYFKTIENELGIYLSGL